MAARASDTKPELRQIDVEQARVPLQEPPEGSARPARYRAAQAQEGRAGARLLLARPSMQDCPKAEVEYWVLILEDRSEPVPGPTEPHRPHQPRLASPGAVGMRNPRLAADWGTTSGVLAREPWSDHAESLAPLPSDPSFTTVV